MFRLHLVWSIDTTFGCSSTKDRRVEFEKKGPIHTSEKAVDLGKFSVITNALLKVSHNFTNFVWDGAVFKGTKLKFVPGKN